MLPGERQTKHRSVLTRRQFTVLSLLLLIAYVAAFVVQRDQQPCDETGRSWSCPIEYNPHARPGTESSLHLTAVAFSDDGKVGMAAGWSDEILVTTNGGASWQLRHAETASDFYHISLLGDGRTAWATGEQGTVSTADAGLRWASRDVPGNRSMAFSANGKLGWVIGLTAPSRTEDAGATWRQQAILLPPEGESEISLTSIDSSADGTLGWITGNQGLLFSTADGGATWQRRNIGAKATLLKVRFSTDHQRGWIVGQDGAFYTTQNGGRSWSATSIAQNTVILDAASDTTGRQILAVAKDGIIHSSPDYGVTWERQQTAIAADLSAVYMSADGRSAWAAGNKTLLATHDGGRTWENAMPYSRYPAPWFFIVAGLLAAAYAAGLILKLRKPGAQVTEERIASQAISDSPIEHKEQDLLGFSAIAGALATFLRHEKTLPSLTIAITAAWGQGKSSLMGLIRAQLKEAGAPTVWFNAWHHQKEPVMLAALLAAVVSQAIPPWHSRHGLIFRVKLVWIRVRKRPLTGALPLLMLLELGLLVTVLLCFWLQWIFLVLSGTDVQLQPDFRAVADTVANAVGTICRHPALRNLLGGEWSKFIKETFGAADSNPTAIFSLAYVLAPLVSLYLLATYFCRPFPANPGALLFSAGNRLSLAQAEDQTTLRQRFRDHFKDVTLALRPRTLTIFVDDLDRCESAKAAEMLEAINYLSDSGLCFIVLAIAREIVEAQLGETYAALAEQTAEFERAHAYQVDDHKELNAADKAYVRLRYARKYLKKLIQIEVPVPVFDSNAMEALLSPQTVAGGADAAPAQRELRQFQHLCERIERRRRWLLRIFGALLMAMAAFWLVSQVNLWLQDTADMSRINRKAIPIAALTQNDETVKGLRKYVFYGKYALATQQAAAAAQPKRGQANQADIGLQLADRQARLLQAEQLLDTIEKYLRPPQLVAEADARADEFASKQFNQALFLLDRLMKLDQEYQAVLQSAKKIDDTGKPAPRPPAPAPPIARPALLAETDATLVAQQWSSLALAVPCALIIVMWMAVVIAGRDRYVVRDVPAYMTALARWQRVLMTRETMRAPREVRRFMNLSRYITLRANAWQYQHWRWWHRHLARIKKVQLSGGRKDLNEGTIVALTTLFLTRPKHIQGKDVADFLYDPLKWAGADDEYFEAIKRVLSATPQQAAAWSVADVHAFLHAAGEVRQDEDTKPVPLPGR